MADNSGMSQIRGIDIDKLAKGFADEETILKKFVSVTSTSAREIRWYSKTSGFLAGTTTTGITSDLIDNTDQLAQPTVVEQSWTRNTSYVRKYFVESPVLSSEDIKDSDIDILATNIRDLTRAIAYRVDTRIFNVLTESLTPVNINSTAAAGTGWDDTTNGDPIGDLMTAKRKIRAQGYNPEGAVLYINPIEHENLLKWLISTKGSSIPNFSSERIKDGVVMNLLGLKVVVSQNATTDYALVFVPNRAATWKQFTPITARTVEEVGIGTKIRIWEEGEAILTDPKAVHLTTDTVT